MRPVLSYLAAGLLGRAPSRALGLMAPLRLFSTTGPAAARQAVAGAKPASARRSRAAPKSENLARIQVLRKNMFSPAPAPLRMGRLRYLRHWTILRAWRLFRRQQREARARERQRIHAALFSACEELRTTAGPGNRPDGYLYRVAMEKKGVYGLDGVPIEYARFQTETPAREAWNHGWKR